MRLHEAIAVATLAHNGQFRKGSAVPYIVHPFEVCQILTAMGTSEEVLIAGMLHDTIEDTTLTYDDIIGKFGLSIANLVVANSENKTLSWEARKSHTISFLKDEASDEVRQIAFADKLSNLRSLACDHGILGDALWQRFNRGREKQQWYYGQLVPLFSTATFDPWNEEFKHLFETLFHTTSITND